jgi:uncharacterized membrane protein
MLIFLLLIEMFLFFWSFLQIILSVIFQVSVWLLFNANSSIYQLYQCENKLIFSEMTRSALY